MRRSAVCAAAATVAAVIGNLVLGNPAEAGEVLPVEAPPAVAPQ